MLPNISVAALDNRPDAARDNGIFFRAGTTGELLTNQTGAQTERQLELDAAGADGAPEALLDGAEAIGDGLLVNASPPTAKTQN